MRLLHVLISIKEDNLSIILSGNGASLYISIENPIYQPWESSIYMFVCDPRGNFIYILIFIVLF